MNDGAIGRRAPAAVEAAPLLDTSALVALLFFLSGGTSLLLETAAVRAFLELFGSTAASLGAVGGAFLVCLALGAWLVGTKADRVERPLLWYAALEAIACVGSFVALWAMGGLDWLADSLARSEVAGDGRLWTRLLAAVLVLLLPGGALGATLPFLSRLRAATRTRGIAAGGLQAASAIGAAAGALVASTVLLAAVGTRGTWMIGAGINGLVAVAAFVLARLDPRGSTAGVQPSETHERAPESAASLSDASVPLAPLTIASALTGFAVLAFEVLLFRALGQVARGSQDTLGVLLAVFLGSGAIGTAIGVALSKRRAASGFVVGQLLSAVVPLVTLLLLRFMANAADLSWWRAGANAFTWVGRLAGELLGALAIAGPVALATAIAFPCACELLPRDRAGFGRQVAWLSGGWTLGAAAAGVLVPGFVLPRLGLRSSLIATALLPLVALAVAWVGVVAARRRVGAARFSSRLAAWCGGALAAMAALLFVPIGGQSSWHDPLLFVRRVAGPEGGYVVHYVEDSAANVAVIVHSDGQKVLAVNDQLALGGSGDSRVEAMQGILPAILHPAPKRVLALGVGAGLTVAALRDIGCEQIDAVELLPSVLSALPYFGTENGGIVHDPRVHWIANDARSFVRAAAPESYDLIVGDLFFPWETEAGLLFTRDHFERVKRLLKPDGLFCQWLPCHQLRWEEIGLIGRTFCDVFEGATLWLARPEFPFPILGLIATKERFEIDVQKLGSRLENHPARDLLERLGVADVRDLLSLYVADEWFFREKFDEVGINVADRPRVEFLAARRVESDDVVALRNRLSLFELKEDVVTRMSQSAIEKKKLVEVRRDLAQASRTMWQLYEGQTAALTANANRQLPPEQQKNDPEQLDLQAFQIIGGVLRDRPDHAPAMESMVRWLLQQLRLRHYSVVNEAVQTLEKEPAIGPRARLANLRGIAFLLGICDPDAVKPDQEEKAIAYAVTDLRRAVELDAKLVEAQVNLGIALFLQGTQAAWDEARARLGEARDRIAAPGRAERHGLPASAEAIFSFLTGKPDEARSWLERAAGQPWVVKIAERMEAGARG